MRGKSDKLVPTKRTSWCLMRYTQSFVFSIGYFSLISSTYSFLFCSFMLGSKRSLQRPMKYAVNQDFAITLVAIMRKGMQIIVENQLRNIMQTVLLEDPFVFHRFKSHAMVSQWRLPFPSKLKFAKRHQRRIAQNKQRKKKKNRFIYGLWEVFGYFL